MSNTLPVKVLSVRQPHAWLLVNGWKDIDYRTWATNYRGTIFIHASKTIDRQIYRGAWEHIVNTEGMHMPPIEEAVTGAIIGCVELVDVVTGELAVNAYDTDWEIEPSMNNFIVREPHTLSEPFPIERGQAGHLFTIDLPEELVQRAEF